MELETIEQVIDIEAVIRNSNNKFLKSLPRFFMRLIKKFIRQDEINATIHRSRSLTGVPFINDVLKGWNVTVETEGAENVPSSGRFIFVANHPVGAIDALAFFNVIYRFFPDLISPSNELLNHITNLRPLILGLNVFGKNTKETAARLNDLYESDTQVMIFPSGEVSRRRKGKISDPVWQKSFITKAIKYKRDIIPVYISGRNSNFFYFVANFRTFLGIKMYIETMLLPREMMNQRNSTIKLKIGKVIPCQTFTNELPDAGWAQEVKKIVYSILHDKI